MQIRTWHLGKLEQYCGFGRFTKQDFVGYLLPKFKDELDRQRLVAGEGGVRSGQGPCPLSASQELAIALAFYASGSFQVEIISAYLVYTYCG